MTCRALAPPGLCVFLDTLLWACALMGAWVLSLQTSVQLDSRRAKAGVPQDWGVCLSPPQDLPLLLG